MAFHKKGGLKIEDMVRSHWVYRQLRNLRATKSPDHRRGSLGRKEVYARVAADKPVTRDHVRTMARLAEHPGAVPGARGDTLSLSSLHSAVALLRADGCPEDLLEDLARLINKVEAHLRERLDEISRTPLTSHGSGGGASAASFLASA